jgi:signal transduction histidine kinase
MLLQNELKYKCTVNTNLKATREVECFPSEINQVLVNLIVNAAQAMKSSGGVLEVSTEDAKDAVLIRVKDNGVGISAENLPKLFSPFFTTKPAGEGTGLGLAISYGIVHKHGGKLLVASSVGVGTEFTIEIPYQAVVSADVKKICETAA